MSLLLVLLQNCEQATRQTEAVLGHAGLRVVRSFDLRQVDGLPDDCDCPYHGTALCDCQMVVLLVYGEAATPATLVAHGRSGKTWLTLVDSPEQRPLPDLAQRITTALQSNIIVKG
jgi:hypothetical protein